MAHERKCIVDLTNYKYCSHCGQYNSDETWRYVFCSENCRGIYGVAEKYVAGKITELEAQELLKAFDLSNKNNFHASIKKNIDDIYSVKPVEKIKYTSVEDKKDEDLEIDTDINESVDINTDEVVDVKVKEECSTSTTTQRKKRNKNVSKYNNDEVIVD